MYVSLKKRSICFNLQRHWLNPQESLTSEPPPPPPLAAGVIMPTLVTPFPKDINSLSIFLWRSSKSNQARVIITALIIR